MTLNQFLARLREVPMRWTAVPCLRGVNARGHKHCPISAVTGDPTDLYCPVKAAMTKLGMSMELAEKLVASADSGIIEKRKRPHPYIYKRLRAACEAATKEASK